VSDTYSFGLVLAVTAVVGLVAVLSSRLTQRVRVPAPALFLIGTAIADEIVPSLRAPSTAECVSAGPGSVQRPRRSRW